MLTKPDQLNNIVWRSSLYHVGTDNYESIYVAWKLMFGFSLNTDDAIKVEDGGDCMHYYMPNGYLATVSYPGNSSIAKLPDSDDCERTKIRLTFKTPDVVDQALEAFGDNREEIRKVLKTWIEYDEYITVEFDIKEKTAFVVKNNR